MTMQRLPLTRLKGKQICLIIINNSPNHSSKFVNHTMFLKTLSLKLISIVKKEKNLLTFSHPLTSHPHWATVSEHLFHCGAEMRDATLRDCQCSCYFTVVYTIRNSPHWKICFLVLCWPLLRFECFCSCLHTYKFCNTTQ